MTFSKEIKDDLAILTLKGKLMGGPDTEKLRNEIHDITDQGIKQLVINLEKIKWINSSGLGALMTAMTSMKNAGGKLKLAKITDRVESLLMITQLITIFETYETIEEAIGSF